jgi:hypothetical protein
MAQPQWERRHSHSCQHDVLTQTEQPQQAASCAVLDGPAGTLLAMVGKDTATGLLVRPRTATRETLGDQDSRVVSRVGHVGPGHQVCRLIAKAPQQHLDIVTSNCSSGSAYRPQAIASPAMLAVTACIP